MKRCQLPGESIRMVTCTTCEEINRCKKFRDWYHNEDNKKKYNDFVLDYVHKFPEKYELKGAIMEKSKKTENYILVFEDKKMVKSFPKSKIQKMSEAELLSLKDKTLIESTPKKLELIYSIKIKPQYWDGKLTKVKKESR